MKTKIIEATNGGNWGKFCLCRFDSEHQLKSSIDENNYNLLSSIGWNEKNIWVLDMQTQEGAAFVPGGLASADLNKHKIWVCPLFEPFLKWLYLQKIDNLDDLPNMVNLHAEFAMQGFRREGKHPEWYIAKFIPNIERCEPRNIGIIVHNIDKFTAKFIEPAPDYVKDPDNYRQWLSSWRSMFERYKDKEDFGKRIMRTSKGNYLVTYGGLTTEDINIENFVQELYYRLVA